jgi:hypothetical protein
VNFQYKLTGDNNILSIFVQTVSGKRTLLWSLHGNHGSTWKNGIITYWPAEKLEVGLMHNWHYRLNFDLDKNFITAERASQN